MSAHALKGPPRRAAVPLRLVALGLAALLAVLVPLVASTGVDLPGRRALAVAFFLLVPGVPLALALRLRNALLTLALAIASSLAVAVIAGTAAIATGWWHPVSASWVVTAVALVLSAVAFGNLRHGLPVAGWVIRLPDGSGHRLDRPLVVGRRPAPVPDHGTTDLLTVRDATRTVSKVHLVLEPDEGAVRLLDQVSANGSVVTSADGWQRRARSGEPLAVRPGDIVSFGRSWLRLERAVAVDGPADEPSGTTTTVEVERPSRVEQVAVWGAVALAGLVWWWSTRHVDLDRAASLGLLPVVGWRYVLALVLISGVTAYSLTRQRLDHLVLAACVLVVALIGYATVSTADGQGSVPVGWVHVAFSQYISVHGTVPKGYDARFSWPGFFAAGAQLVALAGTLDARSFLPLASVVFTMAALPGLLVVARAITRSWRWSWVAVLIYLVGNWYQQDYFSPQAVAFVIYVTVLGALLWLLDGADVEPLTGSWRHRARQLAGRVPGLRPGMTPRRGAALGLVLALLLLAVVLDHQLTPLTLVFSLLVFTVTGLARYRLLWLFTGLALASWFSYGATDYWRGHLENVFGDLGQVGKSVGSGVSGRLVGDPTYKNSQYVRILSSLLVFGGGALGALFLRKRRDVVLLAGLAAAPFALLFVQGYGGEGVIRTFLYASPVLAPLTAVAIRELLALGARRLAARTAARSLRPALARWRQPLVALPVVLVALLLLTFTRGLNVSFERTAPEQLAASQMIYDRARTGDAVGMASSLGLTPRLNLDEVSVVTLGVEACLDGSLTTCLSKTPPRFVLLTGTQERYGEVSEGRPVGWLWPIGDRLVESGRYQLALQLPGVRLLEATTTKAGG